MSADPAMADGLNWYRYANNNPIMYSDPTGLESEGGGSKKDEYREKIAEFQERFRNAQSDEERGAIAQEARNWFLNEIGMLDEDGNIKENATRKDLNKDNLNAFWNLTKTHGKSMELFREMMNIHESGRELDMGDAVVLNPITGQPILDANGSPIPQDGWRRENADYYHWPKGAQGVIKMVHDDGREIVMVKRDGQWKSINNSLSIFFGESKPTEGMNKYRGTFNFVNNHVNSGWHKKLDVNPWKEYEGGSIIGGAFVGFLRKSGYKWF